MDDRKVMSLRADPKIARQEAQREAGSILVTYASLAAQEMSPRCFIQAKGGVYTLIMCARRSKTQRLISPIGVTFCQGMVPMGNPSHRIECHLSLRIEPMVAAFIFIDGGRFAVDVRLAAWAHR